MKASRLLAALVQVVVVAVALLAFPVPVFGATSNTGLPAATADYQAAADSLCPGGSLSCVNRTVSTLQTHTDILMRSCSDNAVFALTYYIVTAVYHDTVAADPSFFDSNAAVNTEDTVFAHYYFGAYSNWYRGTRSAVPPAWQIAFAAADAQRVNAAGNLLLGINAHVSNDLPFVIAALNMHDKADHDKVNQILQVAYPKVLQAIHDHLDPSLQNEQVLGTTLVGDTLFEFLVALREAAWQNAQLLEAAPDPLTRSVVASGIEDSAAAYAKAIMISSAYPPLLGGAAARNAYCAANGWPFTI